MKGRAKVLIQGCVGGVVILALVLIIGCPPAKIALGAAGNDGILPKNGVILCKTAVCDLTAGEGQAGSGTVVGTVTVSNDNYNLYVTFTPASGYAVGDTHVDVSCTAPTERGAPGSYLSIVTTGATYPNSVTHTFAFGSLGSDGCEINCDTGLPVYIRAHANTTTADGGDANTGFGGVRNCDGNATGTYENPAHGSWYAYIAYGIDCCVTPPPQDSCRTVTQGGWGAPAHGDNPGTIRDAEFATCFPSGMVLGCTGGKTLTITSAAALEAFLPAGGPPKKLSANEVNPLTSSAGVLAGQLAAIKMTLCADANFPDFSDCVAGSLGSRCYNDSASALNGMTIDQIVAVADDVIGGCSTAYSPGVLAAALTNINEDFDNGNDLGYLLSCS